MKINGLLVNCSSSLLMKWQTLLSAGTWYPYGCFNGKPSGNLKAQR